MSEQEEQGSGSGFPSSSSWPGQTSIRSPRHTVSINPAATSLNIPSSVFSTAEIHGGRSSSSSSGGDIGASGSTMQHEGMTASSSSSSSGSVTASTSLTSAQARAARARVSMACIHCRQRKIRCDGQQPTCSTCFRLGRYCVYESISEVENQLAREKKRRSKDVKQARLKALAGIGIAIPSNPDLRLSSLKGPSTPLSSSATPVLSSGAKQSTQYTSSGAIRDSRLARQERERSRPYKNVHTSQPPSPMYPPNQQQQYQRQQQQQHALQGQQQQQQQQGLHRISSDSVVQAQSGRKRGITLDSIPTHFQPSYKVEEYGNDSMETNVPMTFTSLSQPTTPEATYSTHASILSQELSHPTSREPLTRPTTIPAIYDIQATPIPTNHDDKGSFLHSGFNYTPSPTYPSAEQSISSARSSAGNDTMATSYSSMSQQTAGAVEGVSPLAMQRFMADNPDLEAQLALRRRSSFDVGDFWRRTSVADAAVANFFDRVIAAKGSRKDSTEGMGGSPLFRRYPVGPTSQQQMFPLATSSSNPIAGPSGLPAAALSSSSSSSTSAGAGAGTDAQYQLYNNFQGIMQNAAQLDTPYTALNSNPERLVFSHPFTLASQQQEQEQQQQQQQQQQSIDSASYSIPRAHHQAQESNRSGPISMTSSAYIPSTTVHGAYPTNESNTSGSQGSHPFQGHDQTLHLEQLPLYDIHRRQGPISGSDSSTGGGMPFQEALSPTSHHTLSAHGSEYEVSNSSGINYFSRPISGGTATTAAAAPPLPTPMTELSSNMFAMGVPSTSSPNTLSASPHHLAGNTSDSGGYPLHSYFPQDDSGQLQRSMGRFANSRQGSLSTNSIPEEAGEDEYSAQGDGRYGGNDG